MLEDFAWRYTALSEVQLQLTSLGCLMLGGILAAVFHSGKAVLARVPYFAYTSLVVFGIAAGQSIWLLSGSAMQQGWLFSLLALEVLLSLAAGYATVVLGQARSRDVIGHGGGGIVSLIPLANFWLLLAPGQDPARTDPSNALVRGGLGVIVALGLIILSRVYLEWVLPKVEAGVLAAAEDPATMDRFITLRLTQVSLSQLLNDVVDETPVLEDLGNGVTLQEVNAEGTVLTFVYAVAGPDTELDYGAEAQVRTSACSDVYFVRILTEGARIDFQYLSADDQGASVEIGRFSVTSADCAV